MSTSDFGPPVEEKEQDDLARILGQSFAQPAERTRERFPAVGLDNIRVVRKRGRVAAGLWVVPMGQWFGGRSVPMHGIAAVGVAPEARGQGVARELMDRTVQDLHERGAALSSLYPATQTLYRKSGYEHGGSRFLCTIAPKDIQVRDRSLPIREATTEDRERIQAAYTRYAAMQDGHLDRGPYIWDRVFGSRDEVAHAFVVESGNDITGYTTFFQKNRDRGGYDLRLTDLVATDTGSARALLAFLSDHRSMAPEAAWHAGTHHPLLTLIPEQRYEMKLAMHWMTRVVSVARALEARGYPANLNAEVHLDLHDPLIAANRGRFVLLVEGSRGTVRPGGRGALAMDIRSLTPLYTGFLSPMNLALLGMLEGSIEELQTAQAVFAGPAPGMCDPF